MSGNNAEENSVKTYFQSNIPSLVFHFFLSIFAMMMVFFINQPQVTFYGILIVYILFGLALKNQGSLSLNIQSVSLVFIVNLIMFTLIPLIVAEVLMFYSLPYLYLAFINEQLIYLAIILPSVCMLIGLYVKILLARLKK
ncbi:hypothetical protein [Oceanobacillus timonensis]|uniref:hypothetical protein n=1 Tax=Oceanobacillus timonensis TaxID=1926285 RepID=UPI0009BADDCE|nr:hypothetical protein [Oceanobacillus timonensis]